MDYFEQQQNYIYMFTVMPLVSHHTIFDGKAERGYMDYSLYPLLVKLFMPLFNE